MTKRGGYPVFQPNTQHRAIDGQFDPVYEIFYSDLKSIRSPASQRPDNHPDAQRVEAAFVADFAGLEPSPAGRIVPMFVHVPDSICHQARTSRHNPKQTRAASYMVKKLISCEIKPVDIMVIGAYQAEAKQLRRVLDKDVLVTTADAIQGQERPYVVLVFSTTGQTCPGFTMEPHRLCVSTSRHKKFLALVGDLGAVDCKNISATDQNGPIDYLANIHRYFVENRRVATFEQTEEIEETEDTAGPSPSSTPPLDAMTEQRNRLQAHLDAASAALKQFDESNSKNSTVQTSTASNPSQQVSSEEKPPAKPMTLRERMIARTESYPVFVPKVSSGTDNGSWNNSGDSGASWNNSGEASTAGASWNNSGNDGTTGHSGDMPDNDDDPEIITQKCKHCNTLGHNTIECPKNPTTCHNCGETGHISRFCTKLKDVQCFKCRDTGHVSKDCPKPRDV